METKSNWKTVAVVLGALAALITAIASLLPAMQPYLFPETAEAEATKEDPPKTASASEEPEVTPPAATGLSDKEALQAAELATGQYISALRRRDIDRLVELSDPPFFMDNGGLLLSKQDIRAKFTELFGNRRSRGSIPNPDSLKATLLKDAIARGWVSDSDRVTRRLNLGDDDIHVAAIFEGEGVAFYYRRKADGVGLAGTWD